MVQAQKPGLQSELQLQLFIFRRAIQSKDKALDG